MRTPSVTTMVLGKAFEPEEPYENPDGTPIYFDADYLGRHRAPNPLPGPFASGAELEETLFDDSESGPVVR